MGIFRQFPYSNFHEMNLDEIIKAVKTMLEEWAQYYTEWDDWKDQVTQEWSEMQDFINNYFDNLNVQTEINNKITAMVNSGEFSQIVDPYVPPAVSSWLADHITQPVGVVIDTSLSVAGACADAKAVGDAITEVYTNLDYDGDKYYPYKNILTNKHLSGGATQNNAVEVLDDDCNTVHFTNAGNTPLIYYDIDENLENGDTIYIGAKYKGSTNNLTLRFAGQTGGTTYTLHNFTTTTEWTEEVVEIAITNHIESIRFSAPNVGEVWMRDVIISKSPINYDYSIKSKIEKLEPLISTLNGNIKVEQFEPALRDAFATKYQPIELTFDVGYMTKEGVIDPNASTYHASQTVTAGERYRIQTRHGSALKAYVLLDNANNVVTYYPPTTVSTNNELLEVDIPVDGTLYVNTYYRAITTLSLATGIVALSTGNYLAGKTWYALGDSITANMTGYTSIIESENGVAVTNGGTSGMGYKKPINAETFVDKANLTEIYDIVTVFGSVNDMQYVPADLGTETDSGTSTLGGCFNSVIDNLYASGNYHIGIIAPIPQGTTNGNPANTTGTFAQYTELLEKVCKRRGVPYLDLWHCSNMQPWDADFASEYMNDTTHPNSDGHKIFAPRIKSFIESL